MQATQKKPTDFILFNYPISPFAEKIRAMLGYANLPWYSVEVKMRKDNRPNMDILTGGYKRVPAAQIGADIFCDTRIMSQEVAAIANNDALDIRHCSPAIQQYAKEVELEIFFAIATSVSPLKSIVNLAKTEGAIETVRMFYDRLHLLLTSKSGVGKIKNPKQITQQFIDRLENELTHQDFLSGQSEPNAFDFIAYHPVWFLCNGLDSRPPQNVPHVYRWLNTINNFSQAASRTAKSISDLDAIQIAKLAKPRELPSSDENSPQISLIGKTVSIMPSDYRHDKIVGELVATTSDRWIIKRQTAQTDLVHVHFPCYGFDIKPA